MTAWAANFWLQLRKDVLTYTLTSGERRSGGSVGKKIGISTDWGTEPPSKIC